jgi:predicted GNAT family acetyltransferase
MDVSPAKISQRISILKEDIASVAQQYEAQGDNTLSKFIVEFIAGGSRVNKAKVEEIPDHYTQAVSVFTVTN